MPDLPLPPPPRPPFLAPRPGDEHAVVRRASRRRRHQALATTAAAVPLLIGIGLASRDIGPSRIVTDPATQDPSSPASAAPRPSGDGADTTVSPTPTAAPDGSPAPSRPTAASPEPGGTPSPSRSPASSRSPQPEDRPQPFARRDEVPAPANACQNDPVSQVNGWCVVFPGGPFTVKSGVARDYQVLACRITDTDGRLTFETEQPVEFQVSRAGRMEWHWSAGGEFARTPWSLDVRARQCARWTISWDTVGDDGDLLPPSPEYQIYAGVYAAEFNNNASNPQGTRAHDLTIVE